MKHISLVVYEGVLSTAVSNTLALLTSANEAAVRKGMPVPFQIDLIGIEEKKVQSALPILFECSKIISDHFDTEVVIIPPMNTDQEAIESLLVQNRKFVDWIKEKYDQKAEIISLCTGAYFLAESGILNGMPATSHWGAMEDLQKRYPLIDFKPDHVVTHSKAVITGGGGFSSLNALLYFIEKNSSKEISVELSKYYALDYGRISQSVFSIFSGQRLHDDPEIHKAQRYIEEKFKSDISVEQIAGEVNMSKRNFIRRFKNATALNPIEYIQRIKIEAAKKALETGEANIADVTYSIGYSDLKTFRTLFKRITGCTPVDYRNRFRGSLTE
ncbi:helix-turn-helix domain-containing protein [Chryseobacterium indologenes]|uniref:GlxA family transcriptional regulator n=1 Tax=Chryseobacterium indologenes TaxID=253 RepID=UPI000F4EE78C|nr:helix-turn-helix domain-containing protein [Chryseobacterium indologenes]AYZ36422.1 helix-turn-helix domain-containing protein [Chryseobacterium indologenes]MBF6645087.1 helix-turn-helix domain-containing protein [Chryseobacterium indologenes]MBU3046548.1 helix-turn-helix domain-containing protein [Chryseobacterium indologenes]MEB4759370.1 helix-turn-helix domain-containing protein [Chryseobacterium indologenes]QQQ71236.1 helix-turn-helix domain-containing protein [Chryseobacterium indologe